MAAVLTGICTGLLTGAAALWLFGRGTRWRKELVNPDGPDQGVRLPAGNRWWEVGRRRRRINRGLPYLADYLAVAVEAGLSLDAALDRAAPRLSGPLGQEIQAYLMAMNRGVDRRSALADLARRAGTPGMQRLVRSLQVAEEFGLPISATLRVQAQSLRDRARQDAEEQAMKLPIKLLFPLVGLIFPALLLVLLGPAVIQVARSLGGG